MAGNAQIQLRRDTAANWTSADPTLAAGEVGYESDTDQLKIGDGSTAWTSLGYFAPGGGGGGGSWELAGSWTHSSNVPTVEFTGLSGYSELALIARALTLNSSGIRGFEVSDDNGSTWYNTSGDYIFVSNTGTVSSSSGYCPCHGTSSSSGRSFMASMRGFNVAGCPLYIARDNRDVGSVSFEGTLGALDALRVMNTATNFTGGSIYLLGRA